MNGLRDAAIAAGLIVICLVEASVLVGIDTGMIDAAGFGEEGAVD